MKSKCILTTIIILAVVVLGYYISRPRLKPLPTKDNPTPSGLYTEVPPFDEWKWVEEKNKDGNLIYRIKLPDTRYLVTNIGPSVNNIIILSGYSENNAGDNDIRKYIRDNNKEFVRKFVEPLGFQNIGRFYSYVEYDYGSETILNYILTKKNILFLAYDFENRCLARLSENDNTKLQKCREYYQIYLPIVEKALSTLEIPDYVDDRGFATSSEVKLLPDELRVYEVR